jgi:RNA polymerase sigma factor (sigma-70 family)
MRQEPIFQLLRQNREQAFRQLYQACFPIVARKIRQMGGSDEDARDIFQDTLIIFYEKVAKGQAQTIDNVEAYLTGVARHLYLQKHKKAQRIPMGALEEVSIPADFYQPSKKQYRLMRYLEVAGQKCMTLLKAFYYHQRSLSEIADELGYRNTRSATVQKYKCLEKVRAEVKAKSSRYEGILE